MEKTADLERCHPTIRKVLGCIIERLIPRMKNSLLILWVVVALFEKNSQLYPQRPLLVYEKSYREQLFPVYENRLFGYDKRLFVSYNKTKEISLIVVKRRVIDGFIYICG